MYTQENMTHSFIEALKNAQHNTDPYNHWLLSDMFCPESIDDLLTLPISAPRMDYSVGKRDVNNEKRGYFDTERRENYSVCNAIAETMQSSEVVAAIEETCNVNLDGTNLRIEFTQDSPGFWLEPHTDIGVKKFTMLVYLSKDEDAKNWGTTIYNEQREFLGNAPFQSNHGLIFVPGDNTWHGYEKRPMDGLRKSLIINYVGPEWRARNELAYPENPIRSNA